MTKWGGENRQKQKETENGISHYLSLYVTYVLLHLQSNAREGGQVEDEEGLVL